MTPLAALWETGEEENTERHVLDYEEMKIHNPEESFLATLCLVPTTILGRRNNNLKEGNFTFTKKYLNVPQSVP